MKYTQSSEQYKGFRLDLEMTRDTVHPSLFHRRCRVYKDGEALFLCKSKKEAKDQIDSGAFEIIMNMKGSK